MTGLLSCLLDSSRLAIFVGRVPGDKLVIGTDHPYAPTALMTEFARHKDAYAFSEEQQQRLHQANAMALFTRKG